MSLAPNGVRILRGGYVSGDVAKVLVPTFDVAQKALDDAVARELTKALASREELHREDLDLLRAEAEVARQAAFEQGRQEGYASGIEDGRREVEPQIELLKGLQAAIEEGVAEVWQECESGVARLSLEIARKVIGTAADSHEELAFSLAKRGIAMAREQAKVTIHVNSLDVETLRAAEIEILSAGDGVRSVEFYERASVEPGGVIVECDLGKFDLRLAVQMTAIERTLQDEAEPEAAE